MNENIQVESELFPFSKAENRKANPKADFPRRGFAEWPGMCNFVVSGWW